MDNSLCAGSVASIRASADLGFIPPVDVTSTSSEYFAYYPQPNIKEDTIPIQFFVGSSSSHVYDFEISVPSNEDWEG
jgi:hypothetical protein